MGKGRGDFLNAEGAKVYAESAKKKIPKEYKKYKKICKQFKINLY
jgi:hypothetical protein